MQEASEIHCLQRFQESSKDVFTEHLVLHDGKILYRTYVGFGDGRNRDWSICSRAEFDELENNLKQKKAQRDETLYILLRNYTRNYSEVIGAFDSLKGAKDAWKESSTEEVRDHKVRYLSIVTIEKNKLDLDKKEQFSI